VCIKPRVLCGDPNCRRAISHPSTSKKFCCDLCEAAYFNRTKSRHGPSCNPSEADWSAPRASPEPTGRWPRRSGEDRTSERDEGSGEERVPDISVRRKKQAILLEARVQATQPEKAPADVGDEAPQDLIWDVVPRFVSSDLELQKRLVRFLTRSWSGHLSEARTLPGPQRLEAFLRGWVSDTLYRLYQAAESLKDSLSAQAAADLFAQLCAHGLPLEALGCERSPPLNWPAVPHAVNGVYRELYPNGDFEEAVPLGSGSGCHGCSQVSSKSRCSAFNADLKERSRSRSRPGPSQRDPDPVPVPTVSSAAHETRQCAGSLCTGRGVFLDEGTGAYYCDACWSRVVVDSLMLAASGVMQGIVDFPLQPPCDLSDAPSDEESISAFRTKLGQFLKP